MTFFQKHFEPRNFQLLKFRGFLFKIERWILGYLEWNLFLCKR